MYHNNSFNIFKNTFKLLTLSFTVGFFFFSCSKTPVPAYIHVASIEVVEGNVGSASANVEDVWVFQRDNVQGVYEMPVTFPIIAEGPTRLTFQAGVKMNGVSTTRISYPFYSNYNIDLNLESGKIDTVKPTVTYVPATKIALIEDFELGNKFENIERELNPDILFEGNASGRMKINIGDTAVAAFNTSKFSIPFNAASVFVELDYKNDKVFNVGLRCYNNNNTKATEVIKVNVTPKSEWNKIYINFTPEINNIQADEYELLIQYVEENNTQPVNIYFDNIKVLYL